AGAFFCEFSYCEGVLEAGDVAGLWTFLSLRYFKLNFIAFIEGTIALADDGRMMNEYIFRAFTFDKAITFFGIEPLHDALCTFSHFMSPVTLEGLQVKVVQLTASPKAKQTCLY